jgi:hypothetical protein
VDPDKWQQLSETVLKKFNGGLELSCASDTPQLAM